MCGEHLDAGSEQKPCPGSSPHVRGALLRLLIAATIGGIIPACAGSTSRKPEAKEFQRDHPRMCGEHSTRSFQTGSSAGSSPHVRGALDTDGGGVAFIGIIPACAGRTYTHLFALSCQRDHPRMCGEHYTCPLTTPATSGSSPHVRGARAETNQHAHNTGIIPACAGSTNQVRCGWLA